MNKLTLFLVGAVLLLGGVDAISPDPFTEVFLEAGQALAAVAAVISTGARR